MNIYPTPLQLSNWIASSHKGDRFVYHVGNLLHDRKIRVYLAHTGGNIDINVLPLQAIQAAVMEAYEQGFVVLAQHRLGEDMFEYLAIRTRKYMKPLLAERKSHGLQNA